MQDYWAFLTNPPSSRPPQIDLTGPAFMKGLFLVLEPVFWGSKHSSTGWVDEGRAHSDAGPQMQLPIIPTPLVPVPFSAMDTH